MAELEETHEILNKHKTESNVSQPARRPFVLNVK